MLYVTITLILTYYVFYALGLGGLWLGLDRDTECVTWVGLLDIIFQNGL